MSNIPNRLGLDCLNAAAADAHRWASYKREVRSYIVEAMVAADAVGNPEIGELRSRMRVLYDTDYVADRIRKAAISKRLPVPSNLLDRAADVLAKPNHRGLSKRRRSKEEEKFVVGARVNWHKLVKRTSPISAAPMGDIAAILRSRVVQGLLPLLEMLEKSAKSHPSVADEIDVLSGPLRSCLEKYTSEPQPRVDEQSGRARRAATPARDG